MTDQKKARMESRSFDSSAEVSVSPTSISVNAYWYLKTENTIFDIDLSAIFCHRWRIICVETLIVKVWFPPPITVGGLQGNFMIPTSLFFGCRGASIRARSAMRV